MHIPIFFCLLFYPETSSKQSSPIDSTKVLQRESVQSNSAPPSVQAHKDKTDSCCPFSYLECVFWEVCLPRISQYHFQTILHVNFCDIYPRHVKCSSSSSWKCWVLFHRALLPAASRWALLSPKEMIRAVSGSSTAEKEGAITANEECVIFPTFPWVVKQKHKGSKQITHGHSKNSTKVPKHRTRYILVVTKNISVTACHTSSFKPKIYHLLRTPAR